MQKLTATAVRQAKAKAKVYKMWDGGSLYLLVKPQGRYWTCMDRKLVGTASPEYSS